MEQMNKVLVKALIKDLIEVRRRDKAICEWIEEMGGPRIIANKDRIQVTKGFAELADLYGAEIKKERWEPKRSLYWPHTEYYIDIDGTKAFTIIIDKEVRNETE